VRGRLRRRRHGIVNPNGEPERIPGNRIIAFADGQP
jgi:hypothetical protein